MRGLLSNVAVPESDRIDPKYSGAAYQVIKIVDDKGNRGVDKHYLVRWKGDYADTWEPEGNLECPKLVQAYYRRKARKAPVVAAAHDHPKAHSSHAWAMTVSMNLLHVDPLDLTADICRQAGIQPEDVAARHCRGSCSGRGPMAHGPPKQRRWAWRLHAVAK